MKNNKNTSKARLGNLLVIGICLIPVGILVVDFIFDLLGANPIGRITNVTGTWTLRFLVATLAVTPFVKLFGWNWLQRYRKIFGLIAFFYATLHFLTYLVLDQFFDWGSILADIQKRPFITVGFVSFVLLIPLAATSFNSVIRKIGSNRWKALHRLVYIIAVGGVIHYLWLVKADKQPPLMYGAIVVVLLGIRVWDYLTGRTHRR